METRPCRRSTRAWNSITVTAIASAGSSNNRSSASRTQRRAPASRSTSTGHPSPNTAAATRPTMRPFRKVNTRLAPISAGGPSRFSMKMATRLPIQHSATCSRASESTPPMPAHSVGGAADAGKGT